MERRGFLKVLGLAVGSLFAQFSFPWTAAAAQATNVSYGGALYKPGGKGTILVSSNGGATWKQQTDLGNVYTVTGLVVDGTSHLVATVAYGSRTFKLTLAADNKRWLLG